MKKNKGNVLIVIIVIVIILILSVSGVLVYYVLGNKESTEPELNQYENYEQNNEESNNEEQNNEIPEIPTITEIEEPTTNTAINNIASNYYYNQLDTYGKLIYDKLNQNISELKTGKYSIDFGTSFNTLLQLEEGEESLNTAFQSAWDAFSYDKNDLFYIDESKIKLIKESRNLSGLITYYVSIGADEDSNYLQQNFQSKESIEKANEYLKNISDQIKKQVERDKTEQKILKVHDWLISRIEYDESNSNLNKYNAYGAIHDKKAVCEGYARGFKYIMDELEIPCVLVSGSARNSEGKIEAHAWNYVEIDEVWYAIDITWDDPIINGEHTLTDEEKYKYFLKGSDKFFEDHTEIGNISGNGMRFKFPTLSTNDYNK